jgi:hypothetical protein
VFTVDYRDRVRDRLLEMAHRDARVVAGAAVGALADGGGDRRSDLDLTFGLADGVSADGVLADWSAELERSLDAVHLFDLPFLSTIYRVFLLPGSLQVDLSFTPGAEFGALGPRFALLFGTAVERQRPAGAPARHLFGLAVHHALRGRFCVERGRLWQAEYWISGVRDQALTLACRRRGLEADHGRGFDRLPASLLARAGDAMVRAIERGELLRALESAVEMLLLEAGDVPDLAARVEVQLRGLTADGWS